MHFNDHNPPRFHAFYQGYEGIFNILEGKMIGGNVQLKVSKIVREWLMQHKQELLENWELAKNCKPINKIEGADQ